ncbi:hypothetical protein [Pedobacter sp.]|uniref:hypothetical protein n=1 Tax=Pedobacter sp. TaxID=1411316 RepID=UPI003D7F2F91
MVNKERLSLLLAKPQLVEQQDVSFLEELSLQFPFFEPLHLLLAKAKPEQSAALTAATLHANGAVLYKILQQAETTPTFNFDVPRVAEKETDAEPAPVVNNELIEDAFVLEEETVKEAPAEQKLSTVIEESVKTGDDPISVSNYNDDSLPYTFLWWLAKTRKAYEAEVQPYAVVKKNKVSELQQQYVEHIFHIQSPFNAEELLNNTPEAKNTDPKETEIIDSFLKRAPQISPPKPEQIDNENKAKKSAEDHNDLVSETLAKIYIEQMLYHKAIDTYHKLSLKFPEKSRYFADLIQSLEKKI